MTMRTFSPIFAVLCLAAGPASCTAPPSVSPLLRVAEQAMRDEAANVEADIARDAQHIEQSRASLAAAFAADLQQRGDLDPAWVNEAAQVYAAAREALVRHEMALRRERQTRAGNLAAAANATRRALDLIERQDALILTAPGADLWRWLHDARHAE